MPTPERDAIVLLEEAIEQWAGRFESEDDINGADAVDWLAEFIESAQEIIKRDRPKKGKRP